MRNRCIPGAADAVSLTPRDGTLEGPAAVGAESGAVNLAGAWAAGGGLQVEGLPASVLVFCPLSNEELPEKLGVPACDHERSFRDVSPTRRFERR